MLLTGEASANPPGRFSQVIVLQPAAGSFYVKLDVIRFSAGAAPQNTSKDAANMVRVAQEHAPKRSPHSLVGKPTH